MGDDLVVLMHRFHASKQAGRSAALTLSTTSRKVTQVKLAIELDDTFYFCCCSLDTSIWTSASPC